MHNWHPHVPECISFGFCIETYSCLYPLPHQTHCAKWSTQHVKLTTRTPRAIPRGGLGKARPEPEAIRLAAGQGLDVQLIDNGVAVLEVGALAHSLVARQVGNGDGSERDYTGDGVSVCIGGGGQDAHNGAVGFAKGIGGDAENLRAGRIGWE